MSIELVSAVPPPLPGAAIVRMSAFVAFAVALDTLVIGNLVFWFWLGVRISG